MTRSDRRPLPCWSGPVGVCITGACSRPSYASQSYWLFDTDAPPHMGSAVDTHVKPSSPPSPRLLQPSPPSSELSTSWAPTGGLSLPPRPNCPALPVLRCRCRLGPWWQHCSIVVVAGDVSEPTWLRHAPACFALVSHTSHAVTRPYVRTWRCARPLHASPLRSAPS